MFYVAELDRNLDAHDMVMAEMGYSALNAKKPNFQVAKLVRNRLDIKRRSVVSRWPFCLLYRMHDDTALSAMLLGVVVSALIWAVGIGAVLFISQLWIERMETDWIMPRTEVAPLAFAALVGSLVSLLSRVTSFAKLYVFDPFLVFVNSLLRPLIGTMVAITIYAIIESKIIQIPGISFDYIPGADQYRHIFWAFGFMAGFSERLAGDLLTRVETALGGADDKKTSKTSTTEDDNNDGEDSK